MVSKLMLLVLHSKIFSILFLLSCVVLRNLQFKQLDISKIMNVRLLIIILKY